MQSENSLFLKCTVLAKETAWMSGNDLIAGGRYSNLSKFWKAWFVTGNL